MITTEIANKDVVLASLMFNRVLQDNILPGLVMKRGQNFDPRFTNVSYKEIAGYLHNYSKMFNTEVGLYRSKWPWSKALATTYTGNYEWLGLNTRRLDRTIPSILGSIGHEWGHCFEYFVKKNVNAQIMFNHGTGRTGNNPEGKENTFQYWLGTEVKKIGKLFNGCALDLDIKNTSYREATLDIRRGIA